MAENMSVLCVLLVLVIKGHGCRIETQWKVVEWTECVSSGSALGRSVFSFILWL